MYSQNDNAKRFVNCYNMIDNALRQQLNLRGGISYTEAVRRAARTNSLVRKYEDTLIEYGRLRNAIVHNDNDKYVIAEPHHEVVEEYEKITELICTPPLALSTVANHVISCIEHDVKLKGVLEFGYKSGFSNIPIFKKGMLIGVATGQKISDVLGKKIYQKVDIKQYIEETSIEDVLKEFMGENYYATANKDITLDKVLSMFQENRKLTCIVITPTGSLMEAPLGIVTVRDIMDINKILDDYDKREEE